MKSFPSFLACGLGREVAGGVRSAQQHVQGGQFSGKHSSMGPRDAPGWSRLVNILPGRDQSDTWWSSSVGLQLLHAWMPLKSRALGAWFLPSYVRVRKRHSKIKPTQRDLVKDKVASNDFMIQWTAENNAIAKSISCLIAAVQWCFATASPTGVGRQPYFWWLLLVS